MLLVVRIDGADALKALEFPGQLLRSARSTTLEIVVCSSLAVSRTCSASDSSTVTFSTAFFSAML